MFVEPFFQWASKTNPPSILLL